ncbi:hypothetical protein [Actinomycetospora cinnamomea]|uniref:Uncharacterized protein n=1 Tax=Actinomycetospora cinnamomea TaxID=663609 RepID=A0A2U1FA74_9PSEU|nr:hypothetical protein [Actinomycetospora cinnamomea]PVZ09082.1 hypothetical protein C8D89_107246 [Actinomycetospora cinnamomea]
MTAPTTTPAEPWLLAHATACAEAVATALDLLDDDDVETVPEGAGSGFALLVHADPPRRVRALRWSPDGGWEATADTARRQSPRWAALPVPADADPLALCEVLSEVLRAAS